MSESVIGDNQKEKPRIRLGVIMVWVALLLLLTVLALGLVRTQRGSIVVGDPVPNFSLTTFDGEQVNLADHKGDVVVLNFWASWCTTCEQEATDLEAAWQYYKPRGNVLFLGVDYVDTEPEALKYLQEFEITYPNAPDLGTRVSQIFRIRGVPETYFVDRQGKLAYAQIGPFSSLEQIRAIIDPLLAP